MSTESTLPHDFEAVRNQELDEISKRRHEAGLPPLKDEQGQPRSPSEDLVGLSLSGGGVRSASFNLGLLQSLYQKGVLRHVDFMSTVSGGGYVGSSLSSLALHPDTEFNWSGTHRSDEQRREGSERNGSHVPAKRKFPFSPRGDGRQPSRVLELIHGGHYLRRPLIFLNRYLIGVLLTNAVALSLVFAIASLAAWMFRYLDHPWLINWLFALGFQGDVSRAFFPMTLFFFLWLVMWGISYWRKGSQAEGGVARWFLTLTIVSSLFACAALVGTGDVSLTHLRDSYGIEPPSDLISNLGGELKTYFVIALIIALIPYLRVKDLIRSGTRPRSAVEGWVFNIASRALLYGIPLLIFGAFAQENISHFNENRFVIRHGQKFNTQHDFVPLDFTDWSSTWQEIDLQATELSSSEQNGQFAVSRRMWEVVDKDEVAESLELLDGMSRFDREATMYRRWLLYSGYVITRQPNDVTKQFVRRQQYRQLQWDICKRLTNTLLANLETYQYFENVDKDLAVQLADLTPEQVQQRSETIKALVVDAKHLRSQAQELVDGLTKEAGRDENGVMTYAEWQAHRNQLLRDLDSAQLAGVTENVLGLRAELKQTMQLADGEYSKLENQAKAINWDLLKNYWGKQLSPKSTVYAMVCLDADQATRWRWFGWSLAFFLVSALVVNLNATSLHGFYRNMLSKMWVSECPGMGRRIPLARLETVARGAPYHLLCATVHLLGRRRRTDRSTTDTFIFSQTFCGSSRLGYVPTEQYMGGRFDLANAMAISGAAVSPTQVHNPLLAVLLMLSNSRLGQWLPNPGHRLLRAEWLDRIVSYFPPVPLRLIVGAFQKAEQRNYCFVSDGGHHENLGLETLLLRRCRVIIASDVTGDPQYTFRDLVRLIRRMRFEYGIRIVGMDGGKDSVPIDKLVPTKLKADYVASRSTNADSDPTSEACLSKAHYFVARILYPDDGPAGSPSEGYLIYVKPNFTGDEAVDLTRYRLEDPAFPHDPTSDQFYDPQKFESYRQLGYHIGNTVCFEQFAAYANQDQTTLPLSQWAPNERRQSERGHVAMSPSGAVDPFVAPRNTFNP